MPRYAVDSSRGERLIFAPASAITKLAHSESVANLGMRIAGISFLSSAFKLSRPSGATAALCQFRSWFISVTASFYSALRLRLPSKISPVVSAMGSPEGENILHC